MCKPRFTSYLCLISLLLLVFLAAAARTDSLPDACCQDTAYQRTNDEYPYIAESLATGKDSRTDRACWVDAGASEVNAYEVDEYQ